MLFAVLETYDLQVACRCPCPFFPAKTVDFPRPILPFPFPSSLHCSPSPSCVVSCIPGPCPAFSMPAVPEEQIECERLKTIGGEKRAEGFPICSHIYCLFSTLQPSDRNGSVKISLPVDIKWYNALLLSLIGWRSQGLFNRTHIPSSSDVATDFVTPN